MPPRPIEDIDFPDLGDKTLELLRALWIFVCDICLVVWYYITAAFWAVWTYPPFEAFRIEFGAALIGLKDYAVAHPITSAAIIILAFVVVPGMLDAVNTCLLHCVGYRRRGALRGSYGANYHSTSYGGNVRRNSARFQSQGAKGGGSPSWH
ncbi:hypothetical protein L210DRAFT_3538729 [Boletus edulis BED1]|uniref:Transmembrane protein n=1 Tax=Boletus edulis BED1 TaxID=1328754 RepID=A0AAD4BV97_BOLED|nr:hypothetical protein L210DRAFT_3538729 [Boletus edulis BED1]